MLYNSLVSIISNMQIIMFIFKFVIYAMCYFYISSLEYTPGCIASKCYSGNPCIPLLWTQGVLSGIQGLLIRTFSLGIFQLELFRKLSILAVSFISC